MAVDSAFVSEEVLIHIEAGFDGTVSEHFGTNLSLITANTIGIREEMLASRPLLIVNALLIARGSINKVHARLLSGRASGNGVRIALSSHETSGLSILEGISSITTIATLVGTASNHIHEREEIVDTGIINAEAIRDGFNCTESPARTAASLILDGTNSLAVRPLSAGIEVGGECGRNLNNALLQSSDGVGLPSEETDDLRTRLFLDELIFT
jgi:hypothetical protein